MAVITVLGAGMMGTSICVPFIDRGHEIHVVGTHLDHDIVNALQSNDYHPKLDYTLPAGPSYHQVEALADVLPGSDLLILGVSSAGLRWAGEMIAPHVWAGLPVLAVTKGLEWRGDRFELLPDVLGELLPEGVRDRVPRCAVVGPCIAGEIARRAESAVVFAGRQEAVLKRLAALARTDYYHVHTATDLAGMEVCAALKNAYAMAIGFGAGIHAAGGGQAGSVAMHNYESAVFSQAVIEMAELVELLGGRRETVFGLAGVGDLMVTCNGGRTGRFGRFLGSGLSFDEAVEAMEGATLECVHILSELDQAMNAGLLPRAELPLLDHLTDVVLRGAPVRVPFATFAPSPGGER